MFVRARAEWNVARARRVRRQSERLQALVRTRHPTLADDVMLSVSLTELERVLGTQGPPKLRVVPSLDER
jgi:hypothetical protein